MNGEVLELRETSGNKLIFWVNQMSKQKPEINSSLAHHFPFIFN